MWLCVFYTSPVLSCPQHLIHFLEDLYMEIHIRINSNKGAPAKSKVKLLAGMVMVSLCSVKVYLTRDPHSVFERQVVCFCGR